MMSLKRLLPWLLLLCLAACSLLMPFTPHAACMKQLWCGWPHRLLFLMIGSLGSMLSASLGIGFWAAARQFHRTRAMLRRLHVVPRQDLSPSLLPLARALQLHGRLDVLEDAGMDAFCYGFFTPRVAMTTGLIQALTPGELEAVLRHERHHLEQRDPLRALLWTAWDHACWWDAGGSAEARLRHELAADRAVIAAGQRRVLASALLKLLAHRPAPRSPASLAVSGLSVTAARIEQLARPELPAAPVAVAQHSWRSIAVATFVLFLICVATV